MRNRLAIFFALLSVPTLAQARPPEHYDPRLHQWFENLHQPDSSVGCCSVSDCHILGDKEWEDTPDGFRIRLLGEWFPVPPDKILRNEPNPTGGAVACYDAYRDPEGASRVLIYCFVRVTET